jgi:hypothetical protein
MAAPSIVNNSNVEVLIDHKQSEIPSENTLDTPAKPNKKPAPESPDDLPATSKQQTRQIGLPILQYMIKVRKYIKGISRCRNSKKDIQPICQKKKDKMTIIYKILYRKLNIEQKESI